MKNPPALGHLLTGPDLAEVCGVSKAAVMKWIMEGKITPDYTSLSSFGSGVINLFTPETAAKIAAARAAKLHQI